MDLYEHQRSLVERASGLPYFAIFWTMGCGKSAAALRIAGRKFSDGKIDRLLIIAPNDVHTQWAREQVPTWCDVPYTAQVFGGRKGQKELYPEEAGKLDIVCVNIDTFSTPDKWRKVSDRANSSRTMIVLDEATVCKNPSAKRTQRILYAFNEVKRVRRQVISSTKRCEHRLILTGTPITNGVTDLWPMFEFLQPNYFGRNYYSFKNHYGLFTEMVVDTARGPVITQIPLNRASWQAIHDMPDYYMAKAKMGVTQETYELIREQPEFSGAYRNVDELKSLIAPVSDFKKLEECYSIKEPVFVTRRIEMTDTQKKAYRDMRKTLTVELDNGAVTDAKNKLAALVRLQQICSGFIVHKDIYESHIDDDPETIDYAPGDVVWLDKTPSKIEALYEDIERAEAPLIIITRFSCEAARIYDDLKEKYRTCLMTGWKKIGTLEEFKEGRYEVMVANVRVISRGFNLQNSHTMFFFSNTFSLEDRLQAEGRIYRTGQQQVCMYTDYICCDTVDEKIVEVLQQKRSLLDYIKETCIEEVV